jgi:hypothetical protein
MKEEGQFALAANLQALVIITALLNQPTSPSSCLREKIMMTLHD